MSAARPLPAMPSGANPNAAQLVQGVHLAAVGQDVAGDGVNPDLLAKLGMFQSIDTQLIIDPW
jgi:hypothetical protein